MHRAREVRHFAATGRSTPPTLPTVGDGSRVVGDWALPGSSRPTLKPCFARERSLLRVRPTIYRKSERDGQCRIAFTQRGSTSSKYSTRTMV